MTGDQPEPAVLAAVERLLRAIESEDTTKRTRPKRAGLPAAVEMRQMSDVLDVIIDKIVAKHYIYLKKKRFQCVPTNLSGVFLHFHFRSSSLTLITVTVIEIQLGP